MSEKQQMLNLAPEAAEYAICTDWFSGIISTAEPIVNFGEALDRYEYDLGKIILQKMKFSAPQFKWGYEILFKNKLFARIHVCPTSEVIFDANQMKFEILNNVNYEIGWCGEWEYIMKKMGWKMDNCSRIDIALDGNKAGFLKVMNMVMDKQIEKVGRTKLQFFTNSKIDLEGLDIGKRSSDKWVTCYKKSDEIEKSNKFYIKDFWQRVGFSSTENVERLELKLRNEAIKQIIDFDWRKLDNFEYLASIFRTFIEGGIVINADTGEMKFSKGIIHFVENDGQKNVSRKKQIHFINWEKIGGEKLERLSTKQSNEIYRMKLTVKTMAWLYFQTNDKFFLYKLKEIATNFNFLEHVFDKWEHWKKEMEDRKFEYLPQYELCEIMKQLEMFSVSGGGLVI